MTNMFSPNRRRFLGQAAAAGIACSTDLAWGRFLPAQTQTSNPTEAVRVYLDSRRTVAPLDRNLFGSFLEHLGRAIYEGIYDPGPKQDRPRVLDKAWNSINTNQFGTNEFMAWCKAVGTEPLMGLNLGTGTPEEAAALVEY